MEQYHLPLFLVNMLLILGDAALGYHLAPRLLKGMGDPEMAEQALRPTRTVLSLVVALYMYFNCLGYFRSRIGVLAVVTCLVLADMLLQLWLSRRNIAPSQRDDEE